MLDPGAQSLVGILAGFLAGLGVVFLILWDHERRIFGPAPDSLLAALVLVAAGVALWLLVR